MTVVSIAPRRCRYRRSASDVGWAFPRVRASLSSAQATPTPCPHRRPRSRPAPRRGAARCHCFVLDQSAASKRSPVRSSCGADRDLARGRSRRWSPIDSRVFRERPRPWFPGTCLRTELADSCRAIRRRRGRVWPNPATGSASMRSSSSACHRPMKPARSSPSLASGCGFRCWKPPLPYSLGMSTPGGAATYQAGKAYKRARAQGSELTQMARDIRRA